MMPQQLNRVLSLENYTEHTANTKNYYIVVHEHHSAVQSALLENVI